MNTKSIQINRQKVAVLLLAGSILAAGLAWAEVNISQGTGSVKADTVGYDSGLPSEFHLRSIKGSAGGAGIEVRK